MELCDDLQVFGAYHSVVFERTPRQWNSLRSFLRRVLGFCVFGLEMGTCFLFGGGHRRHGHGTDMWYGMLRGLSLSGLRNHPKV